MRECRRTRVRFPAAPPEEWAGQGVFSPCPASLVGTFWAHPETRSSILLTTSSRSSGNRCPYRSSVIVAVLWPSCDCTVLTLAPRGDHQRGRRDPIDAEIVGYQMHRNIHRHPRRPRKREIRRNILTAHTRSLAGQRSALMPSTPLAYPQVNRIFEPGSIPGSSTEAVSSLRCGVRISAPPTGDSVAIISVLR